MENLAYGSASTPQLAPTSHVAGVKETIVPYEEIELAIK